MVQLTAIMAWATFEAILGQNMDSQYNDLTKFLTSVKTIHCISYVRTDLVQQKTILKNMLLN